MTFVLRLIAIAPLTIFKEKTLAIASMNLFFNPMPQINILTQQHTFIDVWSISDELYNHLYAFNQDVFTMACLAEFQVNFLDTVILQFNLRDPNQSTIWNLNKANLYASQLYRWYRELLSFHDYIPFLPYPDTTLLIEVTP